MGRGRYERYERNAEVSTVATAQSCTERLTATGMGVKALKCFPWYGRRKERKRKKSDEGEQEPPSPPSPPSPSSSGHKPSLRSTPSVNSDTEAQQSRAYFSGKARVSFRHQMDSTMSANDSTF
ncbi:uncharacterized protein LOC116409844 isoform X1 [Xenopus tropicalis]|uniref:Uncharacterized protein LOC116409844 isoform X1 n=1 Tax=Xenopus tropicalis TaxID=8364 RepID=A0A8J1JEH4_XENTR|nr:uncharacterized protein LOC116409844 isoform X1 [Xenopus tropicalis]